MMNYTLAVPVCIVPMNVWTTITSLLLNHMKKEKRGKKERKKIQVLKPSRACLLSQFNSGFMDMCGRQSQKMTLSCKSGQILKSGLNFQI